MTINVILRKRMVYDKFMELLWTLRGSRTFCLVCNMSELHHTNIVSIIKSEIDNILKIRISHSLPVCLCKPSTKINSISCSPSSGTFIAVIHNYRHSMVSHGA